VAEGRRIATVAFERGIPLRVVGGVAVAILCPSSRRPPLERRYADVDLATIGSAREGVGALMEALGYEPDREFNTLHGHRRLYFWDERHRRQVDVFVDEANLCHRIRFGDRIGTVPLTLPLADLAVLKLQVMETNEKDYLDLCAIFADHDLTADDTGVNVRYIAKLTSTDWGLWRTLGLVAERTQAFAGSLSDFTAAATVVDRLGCLRAAMEEAPKSRGWKLRSRVGERKRWYELPEEVH
jgi:hypothetical protein